MCFFYHYHYRDGPFYNYIIMVKKIQIYNHCKNYIIMVKIMGFYNYYTFIIVQQIPWIKLDQKKKAPYRPQLPRSPGCDVFMNQGIEGGILVGSEGAVRAGAMGYPLVNVHKDSYWTYGPVEIVDLSIEKWWFSICDSLPEGINVWKKKRPSDSCSYHTPKWLN